MPATFRSQHTSIYIYIYGYIIDYPLQYCNIWITKVKRQVHLIICAVEIFLTDRR
jgi:hypothetical protein